MDILDAQKFGEHYKKTIVDFGQPFLIKYHMHRHAIEHLTDSQIIDSFDTPWCENEKLCKIFRENSKLWQEVVEKQLTDAAQQIMASHSLSMGEALIIADEHFDKEVGYLSSFLQNFATLMNVICMEEE